MGFCTSRDALTITFPGESWGWYGKRQMSGLGDFPGLSTNVLALATQGEVR